MQPLLAVGRGLVMVSVRSPGPPGGSHSSPLPQHRARPHLQGEFSVVLPPSGPCGGLPVTSRGCTSGPRAVCVPGCGCPCGQQCGEEGVWEPTFSSHAAPPNAGRPSEVDELQVPLMAQTAPGPYPVLARPGNSNLRDKGPGTWVLAQMGGAFPAQAGLGGACMHAAFLHQRGQPGAR